jgi:hypothetical protein
MQGATDFHHHVATPGCPYPDGLFAHAAAFDTAVDLFTAHPSPSQFPMTRLLGARQGLPAWLLHRLHDVHALQRQGLKAPILPQATADRQRIRGRVSEALIMDASRMSLTQEQEAERRLDQENVFPHVPLVLAAITRFLFSRILGAWDGALGAVMTTRGRFGQPLRVLRPSAGVVLPPYPGVRAKPPYDDRVHPLRCAGCCATQEVNHESTASPWTGASHTNVHGAVAWDSV